MNPLVEEYFKRDLTEEEEARLAEIIKSSPDEALRFAQGMAAHYLELGLPEPIWPEKPMAYPDALVKQARRFPWMGITALILSIVGYGLYEWSIVKAPLPVPSTAPPASVPHPKVLLRKNPLAVHRAVSLSPALSAPRVPAAPPGRYEKLSVSVELPQGGLATVKVFGENGNAVRTLFAGILPSGLQTFTWDGKVSQGLRAAPGLYTIEVRSGQNLMKRKVQLEP